MQHLYRVQNPSPSSASPPPPPPRPLAVARVQIFREVRRTDGRGRAIGATEWQIHVERKREGRKGAQMDGCCCRCRCCSSTAPRLGLRRRGGRPGQAREDGVPSSFVRSILRLGPLPSPSPSPSPFAVHAVHSASVFQWASGRNIPYILQDILSPSII